MQLNAYARKGTIRLLRSSAFTPFLSLPMQHWPMTGKLAVEAVNIPLATVAPAAEELEVSRLQYKNYEEVVFRAGKTAVVGDWQADYQGSRAYNTEHSYAFVVKGVIAGGSDHISLQADGSARLDGTKEGLRPGLQACGRYCSAPASRGDGTSTHLSLPASVPPASSAPGSGPKWSCAYRPVANSLTGVMVIYPRQAGLFSSGCGFHYGSSIFGSAVVGFPACGAPLCPWAW